MSARSPLRGLARRAASFRRADSGAAMVEFGLVAVLFFYLFYVALDFGRFAYSRVLAQKAVDLAVRTAVVRAPACAALDKDLTNVRGTVSDGTIPPRFGTSCSAGANVCATVATVTCNGVASNPTANEIWTRIAPLLPPDATIANLSFSYSYDVNLGFLGGPYTPMVTVDLALPDFQFISPLGPFMVHFGAAQADAIGPSVAYGSFSMSLPAEDLNLGDAE